VSKKKCIMCGRRGRRRCPAVGGMICAACCGSGRGSTINCPPSCPFYPFGPAGYDVFLQVEESLEEKTLHYIEERLGRGSVDRLFECVFPAEDADGPDPLSEMVFMVELYNLLFVKKDAEGRTLADRWEAEAWIGLNNDERIMMEYKRTARPAVLEVQRIIDHQSFECVDLLEPERGGFVVCDRSVGSGISRFDIFLSWVAHYPFMTTIEVGGISVPPPLERDFVEALVEHAEEYRAEKEGYTFKDILALEFIDCCEYLDEMARIRVENIVRGMDIQQCTARYSLKGAYEDVKTILDEKPDFEPDASGPGPKSPEGTLRYVWLRRGESKAIEEAMPPFMRHDDDDDDGYVGVLGMVRLSAGGLEVETLGRQKYDFAKKMVGKFFGPLLELTGEEIVDVSEQVLRREGKEPEGGEGPTPGGLPEEIPVEVRNALVERSFRTHYRKFLDTPLPSGPLRPHSTRGCTRSGRETRFAFPVEDAYPEH